MVECRKDAVKHTCAISQAKYGPYVDPPDANLSLDRLNLFSRILQPIDGGNEGPRAAMPRTEHGRQERRRRRRRMEASKRTSNSTPGAKHITDEGETVEGDRQRTAVFHIYNIFQSSTAAAETCDDGDILTHEAQRAFEHWLTRISPAVRGKI